MPQFTKLPLRLDPYKNFKFKVKFDSSTQYVAGISKVGALKRTTKVIEYRSGGDPSAPYLSPGLHKFEPLTWERGVSHDTDFEVWALKLWNFQGAFGSESSLADFRRNVILDMFNEAGQKVISYHLFRCWVSEYQPLGDFDANSGAVLFQHIKVETEGWVRDVSVTEPDPAQYDVQT